MDSQWDLLDGMASPDFLDEKLGRRNGVLRAKLIAWGELMDAAGWCVALSLPGIGSIWLSRHAREHCGELGQWADLLSSFEKRPIEGLLPLGEGILIWPVETGTKAIPALRLTRREQEVQSWLREGKTSSEMAIILGCAPRTVDKHLANLYRKLGVAGRAEVLLKYSPKPG